MYIIIKIQLSNTKSGNKKTQDPTPGFFTFSVS